jgi:hypothetical protein
LLGVDPRRSALEGFDFPFGGADAPRQIVSGEVPENAGAPKPAADTDVHRIERNRIAWLPERRSESQLAFHATHARNLLDANAENRSGYGP